MDTLIYNGIVVTVNADFEIISRGMIGITDGRISLVASMPAHLCDLPSAAHPIDARGGLILPGLINTHTHLPMSLFRGLADDLPLHEWLNDHMFPVEARFIKPESVYQGTLLGCAELLLSGTTTCCDGYFYENDVCRAIADANLRGIVGQGIVDFPAPGVPDTTQNITIATAFTQKWLNRHPLVTPSIFCHAPYTCGAETLQKAKAIAQKYHVLFQVHVAETKLERDQSLQLHGVTPVQYLDRLGILDDMTLMVHSIWVDDNDIAIMAQRGVKISVTTESEMKLASGIAPLPKFLAAGLTVGLGTDGCASNNNLDLLSEMNVTAKLHKVHLFDPTVMNAQSIIRLATIDGAKALGLADRIGSLEPGKQADIIVIDLNKPHLTPMYHPASHLVYAAQGSDVNDVFVAGKQVVRNRQLTSLDLDAVMAEVNAIAAQIASAQGMDHRFDGRTTKPDGLQPHRTVT